MTRYLKVTRSDVSGHYHQPLAEMQGALEGEFDGIETMAIGTSVTFTVVEMTEEEYAAMPEFAGW